MWGHDRKWLSAEDQAKARELRLSNAANGFRRPVQVIEGNYEMMPGVCRGGTASKREPPRSKI